MKNNLKQKKGITLIALVITIVVLLILAGVTIAMLTGENGILGKATTAKAKSAEEEAREKVSLMLASWKMEKAINNADFDNYIENYSEDIQSFGIETIIKDNVQEGLYFAQVKIENKTYYVEIVIENNNAEIKNVLDSLDRITIKINKPNYTFEDTVQITIEATASTQEGTITEIKLTKKDDTNEITGTREGNKASYTIDTDKEYTYTVSDSNGKTESGNIKVVKLAPEIKITDITENSFKINIINTISNGITYRYYIKENSASEWKEQTSNEIKNLVPYTDYNVKVEVYLNSNEEIILEQNVKTIYELSYKAKCQLAEQLLFDENGFPYNVSEEDKLLGTARGREYYKKYAGNAIAFSCTYNYGARFYLISTNENAAYGYCSYNPTYVEEVKKLEYNNKTWYWMEIPFGFVMYDGVDSSECPYIEEVGVAYEPLIMAVLQSVNNKNN